jgi:chemotaxis response regulator CheB
MAFVAVPHLDPAHPSALSEILARSTSMPVIEIVDGQVIAPNTIYVLPPGQDMTIEGSRLLLQPRPSACCIDQSTLPHVFDLFRQGASESSHRVSGLASGSHLCAASWNCTAGVTASSPGIDRAASSSLIS